MATNTLATNIGQAISDFGGIKNAISDKGVEVPAGTKTSAYDDLIRSIRTEGDDAGEFLAAAINTTRITNQGGNIDNTCEAFTKQIISYDGLWQYSSKIVNIDASFEKLVSGKDMFNSLIYNGAAVAYSLREVKTNLNSLVDGTRMFAYQYMFTFEAEGNELPALLNGEGMFSNNSESSSFGVSMPRLENGARMFYNNSTLNSFSASMPRLKNGTEMFNSCTSLANFTSDLSSLEYGNNMFGNADNLNTESLVHILTSLPDRTGLELRVLTLGSINKGKLTAAQLAIGTDKNWDII